MLETQRLASFAAEFSHKDMDEELTRATRRFLLDLLGVAIGGSRLPSSSAVIKLVEELGGGPDATVIGSSRKVSTPNAALANGTSAHGLELDDTHEESSLHPGAVVIPTVLAMGEKLGSSGKDVAAAIVLGYEVMTRVGMAVNPERHYDRGFHPTGTCGVFGSAVAAAKLLGLGQDRTLSALGIAGSQASGLLAFLNDGTWTKRLHTGWAAHCGVIAAWLAQKDFRGPSSVLEGPHGFLNAYSDSIDRAKLTEGLGTSFGILRTSIKPYGCCRYIHPAIDAILNLVNKYGIEAGDVEDVEVGLVSSALRLVAGEGTKYTPTTTVDAQFSMPYSAAVAITKRRVSLREFAEDIIHNNEILTLAKKVRVVHDEEAEKEFPMRWPARVRIRTKDGMSREATVKAARGSPANPLTDKEVKDKFLTIAGGVRSERLEEIIDVVDNLERLNDIKLLTELIRS